MFKNASVFKITLPQPMLVATLNEQLAAQEFQPIGATQERSIGWVPPRGYEHGATVENIAGHLILKLMIETKTVPASAIKDVVDAKVKVIEATAGRKPGKKEKRELQDDAKLALLPVAFPRKSAVIAWINPESGTLVLNTASQSAIDDVTSMLVKAVDGLIIGYIETQVSPTSSMAAWLSCAEDPLIGGGTFVIGRACTLKAADESKAVVRYGRHPLDTNEVRQHIAAGKSPTNLALTWCDRVSFTLTDAGRMKGIDFLDVVFEDAKSRDTTSADNFDADVAIATGELSVLISDLVDALGGEVDVIDAARAKEDKHV